LHGKPNGTTETKTLVMLKSWIPKLAGRRVLVIGDVFLDEYLTGTATRMSREAPVPVLEFESRRLIPGGAANPAMNIVALGSQAIQVGVVGADSEGEALRDLLTQHHIEADALITDETRPTTVKTRIMAHMGLRFPQQVARLDRLSRAPISPVVESQIVEHMTVVSGKIDAILCSDYRTGLLTPSLARRLPELGRSALLTADAQGQFDKYVGFALVKCNATEAATFLQRELRGADDFAAAARELCDRLALTRAMVITRGADGATLADCAGEIQHCPAPAVTDVYDTVGAGDTAIAVLTLAVAAGASLREATMLANVASGLVVRRFGNYAPKPDELLAALDG
jgi:rfaE bifunctional protein kinase chain/domain